MPGLVVVSGITSSTFIWTNFSTSGGNFLYAVNGSDLPQMYDGSTWTHPSITGVSPTTLNYVFPSKARLFFLAKNSSVSYYLDTDSIAGAVNPLNVGAELRLGGHLIAGGTLTYDGGYGPDDYTVFVSSNGELVIYLGTDPNSADTWGLKGTFLVGRPIGQRCLQKIGGDLALLTEDGVISVSNSLAIDRAAEQQAAFTAKIRKAFADQYALSGTLTGWQLGTWPFGHMAFVNVPIVQTTQSQQYVMNVLNGSWCKFTNINATCWALAQDTLYFGDGNGNIMLYGNAGSDNGDDINATCVGAWNSMKAPGTVKHVKAAMTFSRASGIYNLGVNMASDFVVPGSAVSEFSFGQAVQGGGASPGTLWDSATWDNGVWDQGAGGTIANSILANECWMGIASEGYFLAPVILTQSNSASPAQVEFLSMNVLYEPGAVLG